MANVSFKRGPAANLTAAGFSAQDGVFYLTTDTHRLYVGQGEGNLVDLNRYIKYVDKQANLDSKAAVGDFAFVEDGSLLCVYNGSNWTQINAQDGNDVSRISSITTPSVISGDDGITVSFTVNQTLTDKDGNAKADGAAIPVSFKIAASDLTTANKVAVGLAATANATDGVDLATSGAGATGNKINIKGGNNVIVGMSNGAIEIAADDTTYILSGTANAIKLTDSNNTDKGVINVVSGDKISASVADNKLTIAHAGLAAAVENKGNGITLEENKSFKVVTGITAADGHVTAYTTETVTVPDYADTTYHMNVADSDAGATVALVDNNSTTDTIKVNAGTDVVINGDADGKAVSIAHKAYSAVAPAANATANVEADYGKSFTVLDSVTTNNGHVTAITTKEVKMPELLDDGIKSVAVSADNAGNVSVTVTDNTGTAKTGTAEQTLYMYVGEANAANRIYNQGVLDVYTKSEIDNKINGIDAMRYKGTVGDTTTPDLPSANVAVGDTYMVAVAGTYGSHECDVGDLLIATGTETNGVITSGLKWTYVPSGDDTDTQFALQVGGNKITLKNSTTGNDAGAVTIAQGNKINVSTSGNTITVAHAGLAAPNASEGALSPEFGETFTVLDSITATDGHVTAYTTKKITLPEPADTTGSLSLKANHKLNYTDKNGTDVSVTIGNDDYITLTDDTTTNTLKVGHKAYNVPLAATKDNEAVSLEHEGKFTVVTGVARDAGGHLASFTTKEFILPEDNDTTYSVSTNAQGITLTDSNGTTSDAKISGGTATTVTGAASGITIAHADVANTKTAATAEAPNAGGKITVIKDVTVNAQGHTTAVKTVDITLPEDNDTTYALAGSVAVAGNKGTFTSKLTDKNNTASGSAAMSITSSSLVVAAGADATTVAIDLEWGSF